VNASKPVYSYLKRMEVMKVITDYNSSNIPISRGEVAKYLLVIKENLNRLNSIDKKIFKDYEIEFEYDMYGSTKDRYSIIGNQSLKNIFDDTKQKNLFYFMDTNVTFFADVFGSLSQRGSGDDSIGKNSILLGEVGLKLRGTFYKSVAYYLRLSNGQIASGDDSDIVFASNNDPVLATNRNFLKKKNFNSFEGYLRYQTKLNWLALTFGSTQINQGFGYIDKLFFSNNTAPFDFGKLDIKYKSLSYTFLYGSINGDSAGIIPKPLSSKNIVSHYLNINFSDAFRLGFWESVIISNQPFSFTYLNPISFLTSADLSSGKEQATENNALIGFDLEFIPVKNLSLQSSLLIDDLTFGTLFKKDSLNENKFGYQFGASWANDFNMNIVLEFTHFDPFVYSHRTNKSTYTNYSLSLGHALPPNSDEIAAKISYEITNRLKLDLLFQHQRSGEGIVLDSSGNIIANYGGNINFGLGDAYLRTNGFLDGTRINRDIFTASVYWQPLRQFFLEGKFQYKVMKNITDDISFKDSYYFATLRIDL